MSMNLSMRGAMALAVAITMGTTADAAAQQQQTQSDSVRRADSTARAASQARMRVTKESGGSVEASGQVGGQANVRTTDSTYRSPSGTVGGSVGAQGNVGAQGTVGRDSTMSGMGRDSVLGTPGGMRTDSTMMRRDSAMMRSDTGMMGRDSATYRDSTMMRRDSGMMNRDTTMMGRDTTMMGRDTTMMGRDTTTMGGVSTTGTVSGADTTGAMGDTTTTATSTGDVNTESDWPTTTRRAGLFGNGFSIGIGGGYSYPQSDFQNLYDRGYNIAVPLTYQPLGSPLGVRLNLAYHRYDGRSFSGSNGTVTLEDPQVLSANVDLKLRVGEMTGGFRPAFYGVGGIGVHRFNDWVTSESYADFANGGQNVTMAMAPTTSDTRFGANVGGGLSFGIGAADLFLEARYVQVFTQVRRTSFVPVTLGVSFF